MTRFQIEKWDIPRRPDNAVCCFVELMEPPDYNSVEHWSSFLFKCNRFVFVCNNMLLIKVKFYVLIKIFLPFWMIEWNICCLLSDLESDWSLNNWLAGPQCAHTQLKGLSLKWIMNTSDDGWTWSYCHLISRELLNLLTETYTKFRSSSINVWLASLSLH